MEINKHKERKLFIPKMLFLALSVSQVLHAAETASPAAPTWGLDPATGTLLKPGISLMSLGTLENPGAGDGDHSFKLYDTSNITPTDLRPLETPDVHTHHHWDTGSIGNIFGLAIDKDRNIYATASTHWGSGYFQGGATKIGFGAVGNGTSTETAVSDDDAQVLNSLPAAGTIYKINAVTGNATVFAQLPQQAASFNQENCEGPESIARNTGPALGNIAYDEIHNIFFVSNFEDGKIYRLSSAGTILNSFDPFAADDGMAGLASDARPYGMAVNIDGTKLYFGTHELNQTPRLFAIDLDASGNFSGAEVNQNATLGTHLAYTQNVGGGFTGAPTWVAYSDMKFSPNGELMIGVRTGCEGNFATSHNHGGTYYLLVQDGSGLYNTPAPQVPGSASYDAGSFPIQYRGDSNGPGDGYGGVAIYDKGTGEYDYLVTSGDIEAEPGPHGFLLFPESFTATGNNSTEFIIRPGSAFSALPSSTSAANDYKGIGGDIEVLSVLADWGDAPDSYSTDLLVGNSGADVRGPSHIIAGDGVFLGATVDDEVSGAPSTGANGDDTTDSPDDEDGISAFPALNSVDTDYTIPLANITVANSSGGNVTLHAWLDFDGNGVFDIDEYAFANVADSATNPATDLSWSGLTGLTTGITYSRFRITNDAVITAATPGGRASNGEVEDYPIIIDLSGSVSDWGDAPASYLTTAADNGPNHILDSNLYMGSCVDDDFDGQLLVSNPANGDDVGPVISSTLGTCATTHDDEDSLTPPTLVNGQVAPTFNVTVNNTTGGDAYLACWVDYSGTDFDVAERSTTVVVANGATNVLMTLPDVPATASTDTGGPSYMRCRLASVESEIDNPIGSAANGEIEDYPINILEVGSGPSQDWGDAPNSDYPTVSASDGPRHNLDAALYMGSCVDDEIDAQQSANAEGDDNGIGIVNTHGSCATGNDDEDSLTPPALTDGDSGPVVAVAVHNTTGADAFLACWIDYSGTGFELIEKSAVEVVPNNATSINITLPNVPVTANVDTGGNTFMRCRIASDGSTIGDATGLAENGEVEDYPISIAGSAPIGLTIGNRVWIDTNGNGLDDSEPAVDGAAVVLYTGAGAELSSTITDVNGNYIFTGLAAGDYKVCVKNTNFQTSGVLEDKKSTVTTESLPNYNGDGNDNGLSANESVDGVCSGGLTLAAGTEPEGEPEGSLGSGGTPDTDANLTVDFGFITATVPGPEICDVTGATATDGMPNNIVDKNDLIWIYQHKGNVASGAGAAESGDFNGDGIISINDFGGCRTHLD